METIAEYGIKLKVDNSDFKKQLGDLKKEARALGTIGKEFSKAAKFLTAAVVAPITALSAMGVKKYLETTDAGAAALKESLKELSDSWDQMLARVGKAVYQHGELGKKIKSLKQWLDSIDEKKILMLLNIAKWTAILAVVLKITAEIIKWRVEFLKLKASGMILEHLAGGAAAGAAGEAGGRFAASAAGGAGGVIAIANARKIKDLGDWVKLFGTNSGNALKQLATYLPVLSRFEGLLSGLSLTVRKVSIWLSALLVVFDAMIAVYNRGRDVESKTSGFKVFLGVLGKIYDVLAIVFNLIEGITKAAQMMIEPWFEYAKLFPILFKDGFKGVWTEIKLFFSDWEDIWSNLGNRLKQHFLDLFGFGKKKKNEEFTFKDKAKPQVVSFADLNKSAQGWESAMVNEQKKTNGYLKDMSDAMKAKSGKTSGKTQTAGYVFGQDYSYRLA